MTNFGATVRVVRFEPLEQPDRPEQHEPVAVPEPVEAVETQQGQPVQTVPAVVG